MHGRRLVTPRAAAATLAVFAAIATGSPTAIAQSSSPGTSAAPFDPAAWCEALGGSSSFGTGAAGGGWVNLDDPVFQVVALCVFPDGSAIDDWGITYYAGGTVRGADLSPLFGWTDHDPLPPFYG